MPGNGESYVFSTSENGSRDHSDCSSERDASSCETRFSGCKSSSRDAQNSPNQASNRAQGFEKSPGLVSRANVKRKLSSAAERIAVAQKRNRSEISSKLSTMHPLSQCQEILEEVMEHKYARPFLSPVNPISLGLHDYFEKVKDPMDLGTVSKCLEAGEYKIAHELRRNVTKVWENCLLYNGVDHDIYQQALELSKIFDARFEAAIQPPQHMGLRSFPQGQEWVGSELIVYWDGDHAWFKARVVGYLGETGKGHQYRIQYPEDQATEVVTLPDINIVMLDLHPLRHPGLEYLPTWDAVEMAASKRTGGAVGPSKSTGGAVLGGRDRGVGCRGGGEGRAGGGNDWRRAATGGTHKSGSGGGDEKVFIGDDGLPCIGVCHCKLLYWCRFKVRKGIAAANAACPPPVRELVKLPPRARRCSYALCRHHNTNTRFHLISRTTNAGGRDWSELLGQTLCSCCFQQYRNKGTLVRARDVQ